jgi:hypothetical protein
LPGSRPPPPRSRCRHPRRSRVVIRPHGDRPRAACRLSRSAIRSRRERTAGRES